MLLIFDLDDTLIDTTGSITPILLERALQKMIEEGANISDYDIAKKMLLDSDKEFASGEETLKHFLNYYSLEEKYLNIGKKILYSSSIEDIQVFANKGVKTTLSQLHPYHTLAIVTVGIEENQLKKLEKAGIDNSLFSKIICIDKKEKKNYYKNITEEFSFKKEEVYVCGDRPKRDLEPAKELGYTTIQLLHGRGLVCSSKKGDVDYKIDRFDQILKIV